MLSIDFDIKDLQTRGCPVCEHLQEQVLHFFSQWQYRMACDENTQRIFADERGFCSFHNWQLASISSRRGLAAGLPSFLAQLADDLLLMAENPIKVNTQEIVKMPDQCSVCNRLKKWTEENIGLLANMLDSEGGRMAYKASQGVCLRHLKPLLQSVKSEAIRCFLLSESSRRFRELREDLLTYARKHENLQRQDLTANEKDAVWRAMIHVAGEKQIPFDT